MEYGGPLGWEKPWLRFRQKKLLRLPIQTQCLEFFGSIFFLFHLLFCSSKFTTHFISHFSFFPFYLFLPQLFSSSFFFLCGSFYFFVRFISISVWYFILSFPSGFVCVQTSKQHCLDTFLVLYWAQSSSWLFCLWDHSDALIISNNANNHFSCIYSFKLVVI